MHGAEASISSANQICKYFLLIFPATHLFGLQPPLNVEVLKDTSDASRCATTMILGLENESDRWRQSLTLSMLSCVCSAFRTNESLVSGHSQSENNTVAYNTRIRSAT